MTSRSSSELFAAAAATFEAAAVAGRVERMLSEARIAKLKAAAELERAGEYEQAAALIADVRAEQEQAAR